MDKYERISALKEILEHFASYQPNDDVPLSEYSEEQKREKEYCEALSEAIHDLVCDDDYYRTQDIRSLLEQKYDSKIVEGAMSNPEFIGNTLQRFDKIMSNDDSWVSALEYAIDETFFLADIQKYNELLHNNKNVSDITDFIENHKQPEPVKEDFVQKNPAKSKKFYDVFVYDGESKTNLDKAKKYINDFCVDEYGSEADFSDLSAVSIAYTTDEETERSIQVTADLEKFRMIYEYDGNIVRDEQYNSIAEMNENVLSVLDFNDLVALSQDEKTVAKAEEKEYGTGGHSADDSIAFVDHDYKTPSNEIEQNEDEIDISDDY